MTVDGVAPFLAEVLRDPAWLDLRVELIAGGRSNLTYRVTSRAGTVVVRRPPTGSVLPSAHDMGREARVMSALAGSKVPVPRVLATCDDLGVIGAPFYVMELVEGVVVRQAFPPGLADVPERRRLLSENLVDTLTTLHETDPTAVGLHDLGRPSGFLERQLRRWQAQWDAARIEGCLEVNEVARRLSASIPASRRSGLVHGDFRLDNVLLGPELDVRAVLDWEMSTLGDPLADLGLLLAYWDEPGDPPELVGGLVVPSVTALPGMLTRDEVVDRYSRRCGPVDDLGWYVSFAFFKLAVVCAGIAQRARAGVMGGGEVAEYEARVPLLAQVGLSRLGRLG